MRCFCDAYAANLYVAAYIAASVAPPRLPLRLPKALMLAIERVLALAIAAADDFPMAFIVSISGLVR
jgi:hypothetical protein